jgi:hypothetical protein
MKMPSDRTGINTIGLSGVVILAGVVFGSISPWWLILSSIFILLGISMENKNPTIK